MSRKVEGTLVLDGLIEGRLPADDIEPRLKEWVTSAGTLGLHFHLESGGPSFNILPDSEPVSTKKLGPDPDNVIVQVVEQLAKLFPEDERKRLFSTLRSYEYRANEEVQTVYVIRGDGSVEAKTRAVETSTAASPETIPLRDKFKFGLTGLGVAVVLIVLILVFVDVGGLVSDFLDNIRPVSVEEMQLDNNAYDPYFTVEKGEFRRRPRTLLMTFKPTAAYPKDEAALKKAMDAAGDSVAKRLAVEALARGYIRVEIFNGDGEFMGFATVRIAGLREKEELEIAVPIPEKGRVGRIVFSY